MFCSYTEDVTKKATVTPNTCRVFHMDGLRKIHRVLNTDTRRFKATHIWLVLLTLDDTIFFNIQ